MGRHSRKGSTPSTPAPGQPTGATTPPASTGPPPGTGRRRRTAPGPGEATTSTTGYGTPAYGTPAHGTPQYGTPAHGTPAYGPSAQGAPAQGAPGSRPPRHATPAHGTPQYGTPAHGTPPYRTPAKGAPAHGTPAHGVPQYGPSTQGTPAHGTPVYAGGAAQAIGTPARGVPGAVRGGHPQHDEVAAPRPMPSGRRNGGPRVAVAERADVQAPFIPGPRREDEGEGSGAEAPGTRGGLGRTLTGVAAAAVATVLAVVVAGQVGDRGESPSAARAAEGSAERPAEDRPASRSDDRAVPTAPAPTVAPPTYEQLMTRQFPIDPKLKGSGEFEAVQGFEKAPGKGKVVRYRVDVEKGIGLDGKLFADAVQKTLNDRRSWSGQGEMTFERVSGGDPQFVITLASPGTTGEWCKKSGLDTTIDNVSCDSASTQRVMINAFRWAQGSVTFGPKAMYAYRQMLINHEVGHRLGHGHVSCRTEGALAPVMQQQTKSLDIDGIKCRPNPWVYPTS
ncbi:DUF3152 domain-containing protein [Streptomyces sp. NPDC004284]|uniref:DUF3152 domain-containing protein n=1 Tax=Streptomyces sp. NPDC004284 TaxID=3364695 RepID=UPI00368F924A